MVAGDFNLPSWISQDRISSCSLSLFLTFSLIGSAFRLRSRSMCFGFTIFLEKYSLDSLKSLFVVQIPVFEFKGVLVVLKGQIQLNLESTFFFFYQRKDFPLLQKNVSYRLVRGDLDLGWSLKSLLLDWDLSFFSWSSFLHFSQMFWGVSVFSLFISLDSSFFVFPHRLSSSQYFSLTFAWLQESSCLSSAMSDVISLEISFWVSSIMFYLDSLAEKILDRDWD